MSVFSANKFHGPYKLSQYGDTLHEGEIGVYVFMGKGGKPKYVGRSDKDLAKRLAAWASTKNYDTFVVEYHSSERNAYLRECELYHFYNGQLDNEIHPRVPDGTNWRCPVKGCPWSKEGEEEAEEEE